MHSEPRYGKLMSKKKLMSEKKANVGKPMKHNDFVAQKKKEKKNRHDMAAVIFFRRADAIYAGLDGWLLDSRRKLLLIYSCRVSFSVARKRLYISFCQSVRL